jgi:hypothetical protein
MSVKEQLRKPDTLARLGIMFMATAGTIDLIPPADSTALLEIIKAPITIALILLSGFCIYLCFKVMRENTKEMFAHLDKLNESFRNVGNELHERPCIRRHNND